MSSLWTWPVPGVDRVTSDYGERILNGKSENHEGIDIGAPLGTPIVAASSGKVINSGTARGYGNWIRIDHGNGVISTYGHMKTLYAKKDDIVQAGDVIALVGNEGESTGPHLHFQIEVNGSPVSPFKYVSSEGDTTVASNYDPSGFTEDPISDPAYSGTIEAGGVTVGQRVSGVTPQPVHAYVNIFVGEDQLLLSTEPPRPNILQSFEYNRLDGAGETVTFSVFDDNWEEIESVLAANHDKIFIEYGYYGTGKKSKRYKLTLLNYNLTFVSTGTLLSVEAVTEGVVQNLKQKSIPLNTYNPTEAVKKICEELGYTVLEENFDSSQDIQADDPFNMVEDFPISYIQYTIVPQASQEGEELFSFEVDSDGVAYFRREAFDTTKTDELRTYIYQKGYDSNVIDFNVDIKAVFGGTGDFEIATRYRNELLDTKTKQSSYQEVDKSSVVTISTGDITHTKSDQSDPIVDAAGYSPTQMKSQLYYHMKSITHDAYEATLTIVGDPTLDLRDNRYIRVINVTDKGTLHHTSGVYWIEGITDSIRGGSMTSVLKLKKNATIGDIDGIEILNPKYLLR